ncbi:TetR/AcrR family transcriptional regulator [Fulvivirga lutea]|uniref:TetR/AcrR family transcriptional regulator n=1 Tax=Fulvivirga lutea TaxID=2810512 RepID=A0A974WI32_9BACT|nr:TetR/AcrR family transcriptional regulator [Fulvivirga lutea]QSE96530.1 TetR/AcrR family transcriptional regulator [Fulvivirga lutea]
MEVGVREKKSATLKVQILRATLELLGKKAFKDVYVDQICEKVRISKVTFFKYFPQKEDILLYYQRVWCLENIVNISKNKKEGITRVKALFESMAVAYEKHPGLILSLISYLTSLSRPPAPFPLRPIERQMLFENVDNINDFELLSLPQMLEKYLLEAVFLSEIKNTRDTKELSYLFLSSIYGTVITAHLRQVDSLQILMKRNYEALIKGLNS